jgi:hypothetical protein
MIYIHATSLQKCVQTEWSEPTCLTLALRRAALCRCTQRLHPSAQLPHTTSLAAVISVALLMF